MAVGLSGSRRLVNEFDLGPRRAKGTCVHHHAMEDESHGPHLAIRGDRADPGRARRAAPRRA
jgi:hypothetical protein